MLKKKKILDIEAVYTARAFGNESEFFIGAGSETKPEAYLYTLSSCEASPIPHIPGGMMSFIPVPGKPHLYVSIMGLFPQFDGKESGIYLHTRMETNWESGKALGLPFAHRCEVLQQGGKDYLVAATISTHKEDPADWSAPGEVHIIDLDHCEYRKWKSELIDNNITRNHGMCKAVIDGKELVCVSGAEGIFYVDKDGDDWSVNQLFLKEVSEMFFFDLDGDGQDELVCIEPFHGNTLNIYKKDGANWQQKFSAELSFGHGLSAGIFKSEPTIVVGNRSGSLALESFVVQDLMTGKVERGMIEEGCAPTQTQVFTFNSKDYILSANQKKNEVALYT
ncbi:hypothetical protein ACFLR8_01060 [Bacteroidota bacterium]